MKKFLKDNGIFFLIAVITIGIFCFIYMRNFYDSKQWTGAELQQISWNVAEGNYSVDIEYQCMEQAYLEAYISADNQEFVIWGTLLEGTVGEETGLYATELNIPYSIRNESLHFRTPYVEGNQNIIHSISMRNIDSPVQGYICLLAYIICIGAIFAFLKDQKSKMYINLFLSICFLTMGSVFINNMVALVLAALLFIFLICIKQITQKRNAVLFFIYFSVSMLALLLFSTSSPLYIMNFGCDVNIYYSMGQGMAQGQQLYVDCFDHKGPVFFFLYMLGYLLSPGKYFGIYLLEGIFFSIAMFMMYKISRIFLNEKWSFVIPFTMFPIIFDERYFLMGGACEELLIPLLLGEIYLGLYYSSGDWQIEKSKYIEIMNPVIM